MSLDRKLSNRDAAMAYADAWNRLDCRAFVELLAEDARYASQWVFEELEGKVDIGDYLVGKMETIRQRGSDSRVHAQLGRTTRSFPGRVCVGLVQSGSDEVSAVALFEVQGGRITRFDLCIPELLGVILDDESGQ